MLHLTLPELRARRLIAQGLAPSAARPATTSPLAAAEHLMAVQGQNYAAGVRALALRSTQGSAAPDDAAVLNAIDEFQVVRCWPQRGTVHFMPAADVRWMSRLLYPRVARSQQARRPGLGLDEDLFNRAHAALHDAALKSTTPTLTRAEAYEIFRSVGIAPDGGRGSHLLRAFGGAGDLVQGPKHGKQETFMHVDVLPVEQRQPEEPLRELALRYVSGHGPVSAADLAWWTMLAKGQAAKALENSGLVRAEHEGETFWLSPWQQDVTAEEISVALALRLELPAFDEYLLGYANKEWILPDELRPDILTKNGLSWPWVMENGMAVASLREPT